MKPSKTIMSDLKAYVLIQVDVDFGVRAILEEYDKETTDNFLAARDALLEFYISTLDPAKIASKKDFVTCARALTTCYLTHVGPIFKYLKGQEGQNNEH